MTARLPQLQLLAPAALLAAAERVLQHPTYNVQRVSMDEIYTFAVATTQFLEICELAGRHVVGAAGQDEVERLRAHLAAIGTLPPAFQPVQPAREEATNHG